MYPGANLQDFAFDYLYQGAYHKRFSFNNFMYHGAGSKDFFFNDFMYLWADHKGFFFNNLYHGADQ